MSDDVNELAAQIIANAVAERVEPILKPLEAMTRSLERLNDRLDLVDKRVIHLEANPNRLEIDALKQTAGRLESEMDMGFAKLEAKIDGALGPLTSDVAALKTWRERMAGAANLFEWVKSSWAFVALVAAMFAAWLKFGGDAP